MIFRSVSATYIRQSLVRHKSVFSLKRNEVVFNQHVEDESLQAPKYQIIRPGRVSPVKSVSQTIAKPDYSRWTLIRAVKGSIVINCEEMIRKMRQTCALAKHVLKTAGSILEPGVTTNEIDEAVHAEIIKCGAYPSTLNYRGFPKSCCTSVNNVVCHGIPDDTILLDGDIINIDITLFYLGCHGDTSDTFKIGKVNENAENLIKTTRACLQQAIRVCRPGAKFTEIPDVIEPLATKNELRVCSRFVGHGIGEHFHSAPNVWHSRSRHTDKRTMQPGMIFTIEPILMEGSGSIKTLKDGWTTVSKDDQRSAQAEHTVLITSNGNEILTA